MQQSTQHRQLILTDIQKNIDAKLITQYLTATKAIQHITKFTKKNDKFVLQFTTQKDAQQFMQEKAFVDKIIKKKFNLYPIGFQDQNGLFQIYELYGVKEQLERRVFEICLSYGICRINVLERKGVVYFLGKQLNKQKQLCERLKQIGVTCIRIEQDSESFVCSIELINYLRIQSLELSKAQMQTYQHALKAFMLKICQKPVKNVQVKTYLHQESIPMLKAYFKYINNNETFEVFQLLRIHLIPLSSIKARIYYYSKEANSFQTLFTVGLQMPNQMSEKQFQNMLIEDYRKINKNVVQIALKQCGGHIWTGKIYMRDQQSGKELASEYLSKRNFIYKHYRDKNKIVVNIFQDKKAINQIRKLENNTERMLEHIRSTRQRQKQTFTPIMQPYYNNNNRRDTKREYYKARGQNTNSRQWNNNEQRKKIKYKPKQQDFPSI